MVYAEGNSEQDDRRNVEVRQGWISRARAAIYALKNQVFLVLFYLGPLSGVKRRISRLSEGARLRHIARITIYH